MFTEVRSAIARAALAGADLNLIDAVLIGPTPIDDEQKSALWLYAEAVTHRPQRLQTEGELSRRLRGRSGLC